MCMIVVVLCFFLVEAFHLLTWERLYPYAGIFNLERDSVFDDMPFEFRDLSKWVWAHGSAKDKSWGDDTSGQKRNLIIFSPLLRITRERQRDRRKRTNELEKGRRAKKKKVGHNLIGDLHRLLRKHIPWTLNKETLVGLLCMLPPSSRGLHEAEWRRGVSSLWDFWRGGDRGKKCRWNFKIIKKRNVWKNGEM